MSFNPIGIAKSAFGNISAGVNAVANVASVLNNLSDPSKLASSLRKRSIPGPWTDQAAATGSFVDNTSSTDWRVRLTLPNMGDESQNAVYGAGSILKPIRESEGLIFPYTPTIQISHSATYSEQALTHQNYQFMTYQNSKISEIAINGDFIVQDWNEAKYWIAAVHFLRSVTKMYSGDSPYSGNPPPILKFNAYGDYVFKNVPVIVKSFSITLPKEVDYISVDISKPGPGESTGGNSGNSDTDKIGANARLLSGVASAVGATTVGQVLNFLSNGSRVKASTIPNSNPNVPPVPVAPSHVPASSTLNVTVVPIYSRTQVREFNLKKFVEGGYAGGYL
jgi:hypothetical protein